jgi:23S rRNA (cytidine1920-2'-O)/16S rRNA (cytidine1409-2'-O)-methyltransferase
MAARRRLDAELVRRGLADSRTQARALIEQGHVTVGGATATKPATMVDPAVAVVVTQPSEQAYASRGGHKLAGALDQLSVPVEDRHALDAGAAHGGFTDVLLRRGAARVVAVDVAYGQLDWRLREDPRVVVLERTNVRLLQPDAVPPPAPQLVVADLSFISLSLVLPALRGVAAPEADFLLMVKPQFEAGRDAVRRGGVVRDPAAWRDAVNAVVATGDALGLGTAGACVSPLPGPSGNIEFFVWLREGATADAAAVVAAAVLQGEHLRESSG